MATIEETTTIVSAPDIWKAFALPSASRSIRLLDVFASTNADSSDQIRCQLRAVDLEDRPTFTALSYVWGTEVRSNALKCGSYTIPVPENCYSALHHLRAKLGHFTTWVDAICIAQNDDDEKAQQITLMENIFAGANTVYIWLGPGNERSYRAMKYLATTGLQDYFDPHDSSGGFGLSNARVRAAIMNVYRSLWAESHIPFPTTGQRKFMKLYNRWRNKTIDRESYTSYEDLSDLLDREWIERIWTYQEVLLSSNAVLVCGDKHLPWERFSQSICFLSYPGMNENHDAVGIATLPTWYKVILSRRLLPKSDHTLSLSSGSKRTSESCSSDLKIYQDYIHGVLKVYAAIRFSANALLFVTTIFAALCSAISGLLLLALIVTLGKKPSRHLVITLIPSLIGSAIILIIFLGLFNVAAETKFDLPALRSKRPQQDFKEDLVDAIVSRKAKDPKDKVFAIRSVIRKYTKYDLPSPDYSIPIGELYQSLCLQLIHSLNDFRFMLPAAFRSCPGEPSWVPDWTFQGANFWFDDFHISGDTAQTLDTSRDQIWNSSHPELLRVRAYELGRVSTVLKFQETKGHYSEIERETFLENIKKLQTFVHFSYPLRSESFIHYLLKRRKLAAPDAPREKDIKAWAHYMASSYKTDAITILTKFIRPGSTSHYRFRRYEETAHHSSLLQTHIWICNFLAKTCHIFFMSDDGQINPADRRSWPGMEFKQRVGLCTNDVCIGDQVLYVPGITSFLIAHRDGCAFRLVSPAIMGHLTQLVDTRQAKALWKRVTGDDRYLVAELDVRTEPKIFAIC